MDVLGLQISDFKFQISDFRFQILDFRFQISDFRFQISDFRLGQVTVKRSGVPALIQTLDPPKS